MVNYRFITVELKQDNYRQLKSVAIKMIKVFSASIPVCTVRHNEWWTTDLDIWCFVTKLFLCVRSRLGAKRTDLQYMDGCPGKVTEPLDHKGTLTTTLSCLPVVMAMLKAQLVADWLLTHPVGGATARWGSRGSQSSAGFVYIERRAGERVRDKQKIKKSIYENSQIFRLSRSTESKAWLAVLKTESNLERTVYWKPWHSGHHVYVLCKCKWTINLKCK